MKQFHVTYFYLATGMEGRADTRDYGIVDADTAAQAVERVVDRVMPDRPEEERMFLRSCLTATEVSADAEL